MWKRGRVGGSDFYLKCKQSFILKCKRFISSWQIKSIEICSELKNTHTYVKFMYVPKIIELSTKCRKKGKEKYFCDILQKGNEIFMWYEVFFFIAMNLLCLRKVCRFISTNVVLFRVNALRNFISSSFSFIVFYLICIFCSFFYIYPHIVIIFST